MGKFITKFNTMEEYNAYTADTVHFFTPNVSITSENPTESLYKPFDPYNGHDYVTIEGVKWATMNVGASGITDTGLFFQWGDTQGYTADQVGSGTRKKYFSCGDYKFNPSGDGLKMTKYNSTDGKTVLDLSDDPVRRNMGGLWRTPTIEEWQSLFEADLSHNWVDDYEGSGVSGILIRTTGLFSKKIFLPAVGNCINGEISSIGTYGYYGSSSLSTQSESAAQNLEVVHGSMWSDYIVNRGRCAGSVFRGVID